MAKPKIIKTPSGKNPFLRHKWKFAAVAGALTLGTCAVMNMGGDDEAPEQPAAANEEPAVDPNQIYFITNQPTHVYAQPSKDSPIIGLIAPGSCVNLPRGARNEFTTTNVLVASGPGIPPGYSDFSHYVNTPEPINNHRDCLAILTPMGSSGLRLNESFLRTGNRLPATPLYRDADLNSPIVDYLAPNSCVKILTMGITRQVEVRFPDATITPHINFGGPGVEYNDFRRDRQVTEEQCTATRAPAPASAPAVTTP